MAFITQQEINGYISRCLAYKENYRTEVDKGPEDYNSTERYFGSELISFVFDKEEVLELLNQPGINGLRIYYGAQTSGDPTLVLLGVSVNGSSVTNVSLAAGKKAVETPIPPTTGRQGGGSSIFAIENDDVV